MVGYMGYVASAEEQERKLRLVQSAAASAVGNGCDPEVVRQRIEAGIAEAVALANRTSGDPMPGTVNASAPAPRAPVEEIPADGASALDEWSRAVGF